MGGWGRTARNEQGAPRSSGPSSIFGVGGLGIPFPCQFWYNSRWYPIIHHGFMDHQRDPRGTSK